MLDWHSNAPTLVVYNDRIAQIIGVWKFVNAGVAMPPHSVTLQFRNGSIRTVPAKEIRYYKSDRPVRRKSHRTLKGVRLTTPNGRR